MVILSVSSYILAPYPVAWVSHSPALSRNVSAVSSLYYARQITQWSAQVTRARSSLTLMAKLVKERECAERIGAPRTGAVISSDSGANGEFGHSRTFHNAQTEEELLDGIKKEMEIGRLPPSIASSMEEVYQNYRDAILQSGNTSERKLISNIAVVFDRILLDIEVPFVFAPCHKAVREPFDYYMFGQNYIRPLLDLRKSYVGNIKLFSVMEEKLQEGHNVVLVSNHQTEADPAVISLLLEKTNPLIGEKMTYIAGDRVISDPICKPFSMGRNLLCVYSKKHMYDDPALVDAKRKANTRSLKEMALLLRTGSQIVWIAPSGGRDRADSCTGDFHPAPFDVDSVDSIRRLSDHSGVRGHVYPLSLLCYDIMPPPPKVEKQIGERRSISYHGVGLSVAEEVSFDEITAGTKSPEEAKMVFSESLYKLVAIQYNVLKSAIYGNRGLHASNSVVSLSQPWE